MSGWYPGEPGPVGHHTSQRVRIWEGCHVRRESIEGGVTLHQEHYPVSARGGLIIMYTHYNMYCTLCMLTLVRIYMF